MNFSSSHYTMRIPADFLVLNSSMKIRRCNTFWLVGSCIDGFIVIDNGMKRSEALSSRYYTRLWCYLAYS